MSKLIIPADELIGTPLTPEELKGILAGRDTQTCMCTMYFKDSRVTPNPKTEEIMGVGTAKDCSEKCDENCSYTIDCYKYNWSFSATGGGTHH